MRPHVAAILLLILIPKAAAAAPILWFSEFAQPYEPMQGCAKDVSSPYLTIPVYLFAETWLEDVESVAGVEFRVDNLPGLDQGILLTHTWHTLLVDGDPAVGIALAFNPPLEGPRVALGRLDLFIVSTAMIGDDWRFGVAPSLISGELRLVDGDGAAHDCAGYGFVLNCTEFCDCGPYFATTAAEASSWGQVKALY